MAENNVLSARSEDSSGNAFESESADPYAIDFFAQTSAPEDEPEDQEASEDLIAPATVEQLWFQNLPKLSKAEIRRAKISAQLPIVFSERILPIISRSLTGCITNNAAHIVCEIVASEETNFLSQAEILAKENAVFINFTVEPFKRQATLILDALFAIEIISKSFGENAAQENRRDLSKNELAVLEFFALCCLNSVNKFINEPLFRLHTSGQTMPDWLRSEETDFAGDKTVGILSNVLIQIGNSAGIARLLAPYELLENLSEKANPLFINKDREKQNNRLAKTVSGAFLKVILGETVLSTSDLLLLERDDVILIERASVVLNEGKLYGSVAARIGDEIHESIYGTIAESGDLKIEINEISQRDVSENSFRIKMQEDQDQSIDYESSEESAATDSVALDKLIVTVYIQIASRRISLEELGAMRVGQIIELGVKPTDSVELVTDGKTIAIGELINVEDALGVRLKRVLL